MKIPFTKERADWVIVLETLYEEKITTDIEYGNHEEHPNPEQKDRLMKKSKINKKLVLDVKSQIVSPDNIEKSLEYLKKFDYIEEIGPKNEGNYKIGDKEYPYQPTFGLTQEGLELAYQIKSERQRRWTNIILSSGIILTSLLIFLAQIL